MYHVSVICYRTYNISGNEYDSRRNSEDCPLLIELKHSLGVAIQSSVGSNVNSNSNTNTSTNSRVSTNTGMGSGSGSGSGAGVKSGYIVKELKPGLSNIAYKHVSSSVQTQTSFI